MLIAVKITADCYVSDVLWSTWD